MSSTALVIIITILLSGFFSGIEIAFVSSNRLKQELDLMRNQLPAKILSSFFNNPSRFIGAMLLGNNIALVIYGMAMASLLEPVIFSILPVGINSELVIILIQTIISTLVILVTAEFLPKVIFRINPNAILNFFSLPLWVFYFLFYPLILLYIGFSELILKYIFRVHLSSDSYQFSYIDLEEYVKDYRPHEDETEEINQEIQMIQNAISFKNVKLRDCMVPRTEIVALDIKESIATLTKLFIESGHSKLMIYDETIDHLIGYVHTSDLFSKPDQIKSVTRQVEVYPGTMSAKELLNHFIQNHKSVAIIVDEFGGTSGIVTMEDVIEEIFGEIDDEFDVEDTTESLIGENKYLLSTRLEIDYLNEKYKFNIPVSDEYETLAGFIIQFHESIPEINEEILVHPFKFIVTKSSGHRLEEVTMELVEA